MNALTSQNVATPLFVRFSASARSRKKAGCLARSFLFPLSRLSAGSFSVLPVSFQCQLGRIPSGIGSYRAAIIKPKGVFLLLLLRLSAGYILLIWSDASDKCFFVKCASQICICQKSCNFAAQNGSFAVFSPRQGYVLCCGRDTDILKKAS